MMTRKASKSLLVSLPSSLPASSYSSTQSWDNSWVNAKIVIKLLTESKALERRHAEYGVLVVAFALVS